MARFVVVGEINADLVLEAVTPLPALGQESLAEEGRLVLGSSSAIAASGLARLGEEVSFHGQVGDDLLGRFCLEEMTRLGIDVSAVRIRPDRTTGVTVSLSAGGERALVTHPGAMKDFALSEVPAEGDHLHVASVFLQDGLRRELPALLRDARRTGLTTSLDPGHDPRGLFELDEAIAEVDVLLPNEEELCRLTGREDWTEALGAVPGPRTVVKLGGAGAATIEAGACVIVPAPEMDVRDTTGAGDSFDAGFLFAWVRRMPIRDCLRYGVAAGSLSTRAAGGTAAQPSLEELSELMARSGT